MTEEYGKTARKDGALIRCYSGRKTEHPPVLVAERISTAGGESAAQGPRGAESYVILQNATSACIWRPVQRLPKTLAGNYVKTPNPKSSPLCSARSPTPQRSYEHPSLPAFLPIIFTSPSTFKLQELVLLSSSRSPLAIRWWCLAPVALRNQPCLLDLFYLSCHILVFVAHLNFPFPFCHLRCSSQGLSLGREIADLVGRFLMPAFCV